MGIACLIITILFTLGCTSEYEDSQRLKYLYGIIAGFAGIIASCICIVGTQ